MLLAVPGAARGDGDPASDTLVAQNVFYPYSAPVPGRLQARLNAAVSAAHRAGLALKVALIARPSDLGSVTELFGEPQRYARFLDTELSFQQPVPLLVVMPAGFGVEGLPRATARRILAAAGPTHPSGADLARAATTAIRSSLPRTVARHPGTAPRTLVLRGLLIAAALVAAALVLLRLRYPPGRAPDVSAP